MIELLMKIYGKEKALQTALKIGKIIEKYKNILPFSGKRYMFSEKDIILITYPDQLESDKLPPLKVLLSFLRSYIADTINTVHILPFFPFSSDDGFSVIDYSKVDENLGDWNIIEEIGKHYRIMLDSVINHISRKSSWFYSCISGDPDYKDYFITLNPDIDLSKVTRPRPYPLLTPYNTSLGKKWFWTTFSEDQIDLNYKNPEVLVRMIDILISYITHGASLIRLDAIAYIWKETGTDCIHRPETHAIVKILRKILDNVSPHVVLVTETNVPHKENTSYLGNGYDESQMIYQFSLPPLIAHALLKEDVTCLVNWAKQLKPAEYGLFLNFTASHDGIGVRPLEGLASEEDISLMIIKTEERGGYVSYKTNMDGSKSPYELNINYLSLLSKPGEVLQLSIRRFLLSQSIMLTMPGVPAVYFHSLFGSLNYDDGPKMTGRPRSINRQKLNIKILENELDNNIRRKSIFAFYKKMLFIRKREPAFNPNSPFCVLSSQADIFAIKRGQERGISIIAIHNMSSKTTFAELDADMFKCKMPRDLLTGNSIMLSENGALKLKPNEFLWLK